MFAHNRMLALLIAFFSLANGALAQGLGGPGRPNVPPSDVFEHFDCGIRFPMPGDYQVSAAVTHSAFRELGEGEINRFNGELAFYDIGCIDLDDPLRKQSRAELISNLTAKTAAYFKDSSELIARPAAATGNRDVYEFDGNGDVRRYLKYVIENNRVFVFIASGFVDGRKSDALKIFDKIERFSTRKFAEDRIAQSSGPVLAQTPALRTVQPDAVFKGLKGRVKNVRLESVEVPDGNAERKILADETYDPAGNLLKTFWINNDGRPTSVVTYGFVDGERVSATMDYDFDLGLGEKGSVEKEPVVEAAFVQRYKFRFDAANRLIERTSIPVRGEVVEVYTFSYQDGWIEEKRFQNQKLMTTTRRQLNKDGREVKYEFWWYDYDQTDRIEETYQYKKFDRAGNWTERRVIKKIVGRGLTRFRTSDQFRLITYHVK